LTGRGVEAPPPLRERQLRGVHFAFGGTGSGIQPKIDLKTNSANCAFGPTEILAREILRVIGGIGFMRLMVAGITWTARNTGF
jgi:hypothetical protein